MSQNFTFGTQMNVFINPTNSIIKMNKKILTILSAIIVFVFVLNGCLKDNSKDEGVDILEFPALTATNSQLIENNYVVIFNNDAFGRGVSEINAANYEELQNQYRKLMQEFFEEQGMSNKTLKQVNVKVFNGSALE